MKIQLSQRSRSRGTWDFLDRPTENKDANWYGNYIKRCAGGTSNFFRKKIFTLHEIFFVLLQMRIYVGILVWKC